MHSSVILNVFSCNIIPSETHVILLLLRYCDCQNYSNLLFHFFSEVFLLFFLYIACCFVFALLLTTWTS